MSVGLAGIEVVKAYYEAMSQGDMEQLFSLFHSNIVLVEPESLPYCGTYQGDEIRTIFLKKFSETWNVKGLGSQRYFTSDEGIAVGTTLELESRVTGKQISMPLAEIFTIADNKIAKIEPFYFDTAKLIQVIT